DLVFCELLGVGELQRREHDLRKIISFLGEKSRLANELKDAQRRVMSAEAKVRQDTTKASVSIWEDFKKLINAATKSLELTLSSRSSYERQLAITESACAKVEAELGRRNSALDYVIGHANTYSDLRARNPNLVKKRSALQERKSQINLAEAERVYRK